MYFLMRISLPRFQPLMGIPQRNPRCFRTPPRMPVWNTPDSLNISHLSPRVTYEIRRNSIWTTSCNNPPPVRDRISIFHRNAQFLLGYLRLRMKYVWCISFVGHYLFAKHCSVIYGPYLVIINWGVQQITQSLPYPWNGADWKLLCEFWEMTEALGKLPWKAG